MSTEPRGVVVQVFLLGSHELLPHADSLPAVHWTHVPLVQKLLPEMWLQSALVMHGWQRPDLHMEAVASVQSFVPWHSTQVFVVVSQNGVIPVQWDF